MFSSDATDLETLHSLLNEKQREMSRWDVYLAEIESGHLQWSLIHSEKFFRENARRMEGDDGNFTIVKVWCESPIPSASRSPSCVSRCRSFPDVVEACCRRRRRCCRSRMLRYRGVRSILPEWQIYCKETRSSQRGPSFDGEPKS